MRRCVSAVDISCRGRQTGADELGLNEHHQSQLTRYLRFARLQRDKRLRTVDAAFEDCMLSRYDTLFHSQFSQHGLCHRHYSQV